MWSSRNQAPIQGTLSHSSDSENAPLHAISGTRNVKSVHRPRQHEAQALEEPTFQHEKHTEQPQVKRQASKGRLLGLFSRTKSTKSTKSPSPGADQGSDGNDLLHQDRYALRKTSAISSTQSIGDLGRTDLVPSIEAPKQRPVKAKRSKSFKKDPSTTRSIPWDPPPLFQAYPQSIKHGTALAPMMSADVILRFHADRKRKQRKRDTVSVSAKANGIDDEDDILHGDEREEFQDMELALKIYVLVTSGYILQYAGEGGFDRLPEKIMPIGPDSAAFASDAVPGKHWVLQVSHALDENGNPKLEKRSFVKRFGFGADLKRGSLLNFLLVLDNPEDLENWLNVVKREFEAWGGRRYQPDPTVGPYADEMVRTLQQRPSRRYLVKRDPEQFSSSAKESNFPFEGASSDSITPTATLRTYSTATQDSVHSPSTSNMTASTDQVLLDRLRNSPRMSYMSTGAKTHANSRDSSPVPSPTRLNFQLDDFPSTHEQPDKAERAVKTTLQTPVQHLPQNPLDHSLPANLTRPLSTVKSCLGTIPPTGAPNFSVPNFSKRYSSAHSTPPTLSSASSNTSNPSRKPKSPPTITEQHDDFQVIADAAAEASATEQLDPEAVSVADLKHPVPGSLLSTSADQTVPRRFSSLEYSRGISPVNVHASPRSSPHPPPTSALPALPETGTNTLSASSHCLRRPISMQIHTSPLPSSAAKIHRPIPTIPSPPTNDRTPRFLPPSHVPPPPLASSTFSPEVPDQHLLPPSKVLNRRSMPHLSRPPSAPPSCPLPTPPVPRLPPIRLSSGSLRRSVERPLRAGLGTRTAGLVEGNES